MGTFSKIERDFWQDNFVMERLTPEEKYFFLYLLTNSRVNALGCYELRMRVAVVETGYNEETIRKHIDKFHRAGKMDFDPITCEIFIRNWGKYNWSKKTGVVNALKKDIRAIKSEKFLLILQRKLVAYGILSKEESPENSGEEELPFTDEMPEEGGVFEEQGETTGNSGEQEGTTENCWTGEEEVEVEVEEELKPLSTKEADEGRFEEFWKAYPNKKKKDYARKAWDKRKVDAKLFGEIMAGLARAKGGVDWVKEGGKYIPHPATWLNGGGWKDEHTPADGVGKPRGGASPQESEELAARRQLLGGGGFHGGQ